MYRYVIAFWSHYKCILCSVLLTSDVSYDNFMNSDPQYHVVVVSLFGDHKTKAS